MAPDDERRLDDRPFETLDEAAGYLEGLIDRERQTDYVYRRLDLRPIHALLEGLGRPDSSLSIVHVAGSKGKGSTCLFAESILLALGDRVGTFTSPHLVSWVERFRIDGRSIEEETLVRAVDRVRPFVESLRTGPAETWPSFFDAATAVAMLVFAEAGVDRVLLEVGLGGRLDSTNIVAPDVTCITSIELEHTDKLGNTEALIAREKAGILKPNVPAIVGLLRPEALEVVRARAHEVGAPLEQAGVEFYCEQGVRAASVLFRAGDDFCVETELSAAGPAARVNAALAIACVRALGAHTDAALTRAAREALLRTRLPARIEVLANDPRVIVDAAHTRESARALAESLESLAPDGFDLLVSVSADKSIEALLGPLLAQVGRVWVTRAEPNRSIPAERLAKHVESTSRRLGRSVEIEVVPDPREAARCARAGLGPNRLLCAAGSFYLAGVARAVLGGGDSLDG